MRTAAPSWALLRAETRASQQEDAGPTTRAFSMHGEVRTVVPRRQGAHREQFVGVAETVGAQNSRWFLARASFTSSTAGRMNASSPTF